MANQILENPSVKTLYMREYRAKNPEHFAKYQRDRNRSRREQVIAHYGGQCLCCEESTYEFLAVDHTLMVAARNIVPK